MGIVTRLGTAAAATVRAGEGRSTTGRRLRLLRGWLLVATAALLVSTFAVFSGVRENLDTARGRTVPAVVGAAATYEALVRANTAAVLSFESGPAWLGGTGDVYQAQVGAAGQSLAQVSEHNVAGTGARREIQLVQALLVSYRSWMAQAEVRYRAGDDSAAAAVHVWYAAQLLHSPEGMLTQLTRLRTAQLDALDRRLSSGWSHPASAAVWLVPAVALAVLLVWAQVSYRRRFRRTLNPHLLAATALLIAVAGLTALTLPAQARAHEEARELRAEIGVWEHRTHSSAAADRRAVAALVTSRCFAIGCGETVAEFARSPSGSALPRGTADDQQLAGVGAEADTGFAEALWPPGLRWLLVAGTAGIAALIVTGFQQRIDEYRFRLP